MNSPYLVTFASCKQNRKKNDDINKSFIQVVFVFSNFIAYQSYY